MAKRAEDFISFVNASPTPFHVVASIVTKLMEAGFTRLKEGAPWSPVVKSGGRYFVTRNASSIIAFTVGHEWMPGKPIAMVATHTDSPTLRVKPTSKKTGNDFLQVGVETYGGGMWHTWFDRDLSIAGRVLFRTQDDRVAESLVKVDKAILRIPTLAIHLDRRESFSFNRETQLLPICGLAAAQLNRAAVLDSGTDVSKENSPPGSFHERHHSMLVELVATKIGISSDDIVDFELLLYDTQKAQLGGLNDDLIFSARLDNQVMTYCGIEGLVDSLSSANSPTDEGILKLVGCFDHEEVGSRTAEGADGNFLPTVVGRLASLNHLRHKDGSQATESRENDSITHDAFSLAADSLSRSFLISADMAHAYNPNYSDNYEGQHRMTMNQGTVLKINANARYATNSPGIVVLQQIAKFAHVPLQYFVGRNDSPCGSTIGPILSAKLGVRTVDLGNAQWSMHSIRETAGAHDIENSVRLFSSFFRNYSRLESSFLLD